MKEVVLFVKQKTAYEIYQCDWSSDVCSADLHSRTGVPGGKSREVTFDGDWMVQAILTKSE